VSELHEWLLESDPSLRWQVLQDLVGAPEDQIAQERAKVATEGWGAELLAVQDRDGRWAGGLYGPKWTSTTYTLLLLHRLGLERGHPQALAGCQVLWDGAQRYDDGLNFAVSVREPETCITGMLVLLASHFGLDDPRVAPTVRWLLSQQLPDGGWNCQTIRSGSTHGSFHTSITALEALSAYERSGGAIPVAEALAAGREFFLAHHLYRSHRTGEVANPVFTRFPFPPQWHFDIVRALEHFRDAGTVPEDRQSEAIGAIARARRRDGTWPMYRPYAGRQWFRMEAPGPSRWSTFRALRVLAWWDGRRS
jgi:hypothetical protein